MATWLPHFKFSFGGTLGSADNEQWSNTVNFKMAQNDSATVGSDQLVSDEIDEALGLMNAPLQAWFHSTEAGISNRANLTWAKLNFITATGKQRDVNTHRIDTGVVNGGVTSAAPHWFVTAALTHRTAVKRGRAHSGRIFPPMIAIGPEGGTPYIPKAAADAMAAKWATALNDLCNIISDVPAGPASTDVYPVVASPLTTVGPNAGPALLQRVTGVVCDRVADVQHRRTNRIPRSESDRANVSGG